MESIMFEHLPASTRVLLFIGAGIALAAALAPLPFFDKADVASSGAAPAERAPAEHALVNGTAAAEIRLEDGKTYKAEVDLSQLVDLGVVARPVINQFLLNLQWLGAP
jgi:hypothetical protein